MAATDGTVADYFAYDARGRCCWGYDGWDLIQERGAPNPQDSDPASGPNEIYVDPLAGQKASPAPPPEPTYWL